MKTTGFAWTGCAAILLLGTVGACGSGASPLGGDGGTGTSSSSGGGVSSGSSSGGGVSSSSSGSTGSGSSSGIGSSGSSSGAGSSSSSGVSSGSSSGTGVAGSGNLTFEQCSAPSALCPSPSSFEFYGQFTEGPSNQGCQVTTTGACSLYVCNAATSPTGVDAGYLAIWGGSIPSGVAIAPVTGNAGQYNYSDAAALFSANQVLKVESTGSVVPLFGPVSVVAPGVGTLTTPAAVGGNYTIPTSADLPVAWTGGQAPAQMIVEGAGNGGGADSYFLCQWDATLGSGTIPASVLHELAGQTGGFLVYGQLTTTNAEAGGFALTVSALQYSGGTASFE